MECTLLRARSTSVTLLLPAGAPAQDAQCNSLYESLLSRLQLSCSTQHSSERAHSIHPRERSAHAVKTVPPQPDVTTYFTYLFVTYFKRLHVGVWVCTQQGGLVHTTTLYMGGGGDPQQKGRE